MFVVIQQVGQCQCGFGFVYFVWVYQQEYVDWCIGFVQFGCGGVYCVVQGIDCLFLVMDLCLQVVGEIYYFGVVFLCQLFYWYVGLGVDYFGNQVWVDFEVDQLFLGLGIGECLVGFVKGFFQGFDIVMFVGWESFCVCFVVLFFLVCFVGFG